LPLPGCTTNPAWLVDHQQRIVFIQDFQRNVLGPIRLLGGMGLRQHLQLFSAPDFLLGRGIGTVHFDLLLGDPFLQTAARILGKEPDQRLIEAQSGIFVGNGEMLRLGAGEVCAIITQIIFWICHAPIFWFYHAPVFWFYHTP